MKINNPLISSIVNYYNIQISKYPDKLTSDNIGQILDNICLKYKKSLKQIQDILIKDYENS